MQTTHINSFKRGIVIGAEILAVVMLLVALLWFALLVRLSQGPLELDSLTSLIEKTLNKQQPEYKFNVEKTLLMWGDSDDKGVKLEMHNLRVSNPENLPVLAVQKIGVKLAKRYLLIGKFVPQTVRIYGPAFRIVRGVDNSFSLNSSPSPDNINQTSPQTNNESDVLASLLKMMKDGSGFPLAAGLEKVTVKEASILYVDDVMHVNWKSQKANLSFMKKKGGLSLEAIASLENDEQSKAYLKASIFYSWEVNKTNGVLYFTDLNLSKLAQESGQLQTLRALDTTFKGSVNFEMDEKMKLISSHFVLGAEGGSYNVADIYEKPIKIDSIFGEGQYDNHSKEFSLDKLEFKFGDTVANITGKANETKDGTVIVVNGELLNMAIDNLKDYWPHALAKDARDWVVTNLSVGKADKATINSIMLLDNTPQQAFHLVDLKGHIDYQGLTVDYFNPLKKVTNVDGTADYDAKNFNLDIKSGTLEDLKVTGSKIRIYDLDRIPDPVDSAKIDISVDLEGPAKTALTVIDSKPLEYPKNLGIKSENFNGDAVINTSFKFPLIDDLKISEVKVDVKAGLKNVKAKQVVKGLDLISDESKLVVNNDFLEVDGKGKLGAMQVVFDWKNNFNDKETYETILKADASPDEKELKLFGMPDAFSIGGIVPTKVEYNKTWDDSTKVKIDANFSAASFYVPYINYKKEASIPGYLNLDMGYDAKTKIQSINDLKYESQESEILGSLAIDTNKGEIIKSVFAKVKAGHNDFSQEWKKDGNYFVTKITGSALDVSGMMTNRKEHNGAVEVEKQSTPIVADINVGKLYTSAKHIDTTKVYMRTDSWQRINQLQVDATSGGQPLSIKFFPQKTGGYSFDFRAFNAGEALSALDITNSVNGGVLEVKGVPDLSTGPRNIAGTMKLSKFTLTNVSILGRLLNAMSLSGMFELLNGKGISFNTMTAKFWWEDKSKPDFVNKTRNIRFKDGQTSGASLGLTFDGFIDMISKKLDVDGTIIPVSGVNKLLGVIPVVGDILTGGKGGGIIAATYKIKGDMKNPDVSVNPLSVLAPGIIRKIFFEK